MKIHLKSLSIYNIKIYKKLACLLTGLLLLFFTLSAQNQRFADSLIQVYNHENLTDSARLQILRNIAFYHPNPDTVLHYANLLISLAKDRKDNLFIFRGYYSMGNALRQQGKLDEAIKIFFTSIQYAEKANYTRGVSGVYIALGDVYSAAKDFTNSIKYYKRAEKNFRKSNDSIPLASILLNAGGNYLSMHRLDTALQYFDEASRIFKRFGYKTGVAYCTGNIGRIYAEKGDFKKGEINLKQAIQILQKLNDAHALISFNIRLSDIYQQEGQLNKALKIANDCYQLARQNGLRAQIRDACEKLFELYSQKEDFKQAYRYQSEYIAYSDSINNEATIRKMADIRTQYEVEKKQAEIDRMFAKRRLTQRIAIGLGVVLIVVLVLSLLLYRSTRRKTTLNNLLSEQKEELQTQREQLETLNRTKDRFFSIISHDLRGPIGAMSTLPFLFREYMDNNDMESVRELIVHLDTSVQQISHLLDNLLEWALSQQGGIPYQPEKLKLADIFNELHNTFAPLAVSKKLQLLVTSEGGIVALADKNSLLTILRNLLNNAVKFTAPGGTITLSVTSTDDKAVIIVSDNGVGMKKEQLENIFQLGDNKSTPGTENEKGVGLGLTLVYDFVRMNKGTIDVESEAGKGTRFIVKIPLVK